MFHQLALITILFLGKRITALDVVDILCRMKSVAARIGLRAGMGRSLTRSHSIVDHNIKRLVPLKLG